MYVFTARATGRKAVTLSNGDSVFAFPLVYHFKPHWFDRKWNEKMWRAMFNQNARVQSHPDWSGYVSFNNTVYKLDCGYWTDDTSLGESCGSL